MNLADIVRYWAREQADSIAISAERDITWSALDRRTSGLAAGLAARFWRGKSPIQIFSIFDG